MELRKIKWSIHVKLIIMVIAAMALSAVASEFPADPPDVDVIDRDFVSCYLDDLEYELYLTMYNSQGRGTVKIQEYRNGEWETVCTWNPVNMGDEFMVFRPNAVLRIYDRAGSIQVIWVDRAEYGEGAVTFYLMYDYVQGEWESGWVD